MNFKSVNTVIALAIGIIVTLAVGAGVLWVSQNTYKVVLTEQIAAMDTMSKETTIALDINLTQTSALAGMLARQRTVVDAINGYPHRAQTLFKSVIEDYQGFWAAFVFNAEGKVVAGMNAKGEDLSGADRASRNYVQAALKGEKVFVSPDILKSKSGGGVLIYAVSAVVKDQKGKVVGGVGLFPYWENMTRDFVDPLHIGKQGYAFMLDHKGRIIAHGANKDLLLKDLSELGFVQQMLTKKNGSLNYVWEGREKLVTFHELPQTGWITAMSAYEDDLTAAATKQRNYLAVGGLAVIVILTLSILFISRRVIITPIQNIVDFAGKVAGGDLQAELQGTYRFELKELAGDIGVMVGELKTKLGFSEGVLQGLSLPCGIVGPDHTMLWVNRHICELLELPGDPEEYVGMASGKFFLNDASKECLSDRAIKEKRPLEKEMEHTTRKGVHKNIHITTTPFHDMDGKMLGSITVWIDMTDIRTQQAKIEEQNARISRAAEQAEEISQYLSSASEQLASQIEEASQGSENQKHRASETATAMEEMNATVLEVAQNASAAAEDAETARMQAQEGSENVLLVVQAIADVKAKADHLRSSMEELGAQAKGIGNVMNVITDIADQTNLLALNAAIEAARAGEAGRGFAVVADEVRKLAEKTMAATKEVGEAITNMQNVTNSNVQATEEAAASVAHSTELADKSGEILAEIVRLVENAADQVRAIATAAEQQSSTSEEINRATEDIYRISSESAQVMTESSQAVHEIARMAVNLNSVIEDMSSDK